MLVGLCVYSYASVLAVTKPVHDAISKLNNIVNLGTHSYLQYSNNLKFT